MEYDQQPFYSIWMTPSLASIHHTCEKIVAVSIRATFEDRFRWVAPHNVLLHQTDSLLHERFFSCDRTLFTSTLSSPPFISDMLSHMGVADEKIRSFFTDKLAKLAAEIQETRVEVKIIRTSDFYLPLSRSIHNDESEGFRSVPASGLSISGLKMIECCEEEEEEDGEGDACVICQEDFGKGGKIAEMPCSHQFHCECIVNWLQISGVCPLCMFRLPSDEDGEIFFFN